MGLGLLFRASLRRERRPGLSSIETATIDRLEREGGAFAASRGLEFLFTPERVGENSIWLRFHPGEEAVECRIEGDQLIISARTSSVGPGYHAYIVDFLDHLSRACGLAWETTGPDGDEGDETSYFEARDFKALQSEMAAWLKALADTFADADRSHGYCVCLDTGLVSKLSHAGGIAAPRGPVPFDLMEQVQSARGADLQRYAAEWFVWPRRETDTAFWLRTAEVLMWQHVPWHAPLDDNERKIYQRALYSFDRVRQFDPNWPLPEVTIAEMRRLECSAFGDPSEPLALGPGYWRKTMRRPLPSEWSIALPGYWYLTQDDDGLRYWFGPTIWATSFTIELKDGSLKQLTAEDLPTDAGEIENFEAPGVIGRLHFIARAPEEDSRYLLRAYAIHKSSQLMLSCFFDDSDSIDRMRAILKSIRRSTLE